MTEFLSFWAKRRIYYLKIIIQYRVIPNSFRNLFSKIVSQHFFDRKETLHKETPDLNSIHTSYVIILHRVSELVNLQIFFMLVNSLKHLNKEQNKTMMVHYVKVENFYFNFTKSAFHTRHLNKWFFLCFISLICLIVIFIFFLKLFG